MRATLASSDVRRAEELLQRDGSPLTTVSADGRYWIVVVRQSDSKLSVRTFARKGQGIESRQMSAAELAQLIGQQDEHVWMVASQTTPNEGATTTPGSQDKPSPRVRLVRLLQPDRGDILAVIAFSVAVGVLTLATPIAVQTLVNSIALGGALQPLIIVALLLFLALGFAATLTGIETWVVELIQRRILVRAMGDMATRLTRLNLERSESIDVPEHINRFFDVVTLQKVTAKLLIDVLAVALAILVGLTVLAFYHPLLLAFDLLLLVAIALIVFGPLRKGQRTSIAESSAKYAAQGWLEQIARNPVAFKAAGAQQWVFEQADALSRDWIDKRSSHFKTLFTQIAGALGLQVVASTTLLGIGGWLVIQGSLTLGQLVAAELIVTAVVGSVAKMGKHLEDWYDLMAATSKIGSVLDLPLEPSSGERNLEPTGESGVALELTNLSSGVGKPISLSIQPGQRVAIRGGCGTGKTALLETLWRLRDPAAGTLKFDGHNAKEIAVDQLRRDAALAAPVEVIRGTVRANVKLQRPFVSNNDVRSALERTGLLEVISSLPEGMSTQLTEKDRSLSRTEVARLMIARAIAGKPRLLLVDDLCDRMSSPRREQVLDALFGEESGWTLVIVSNLPQVLERCDHVIDLGEEGALV